MAHCSQLAAHLPQKVVSTNYDDSATKANVLLQAHFSRTKLPLELQADQSEVLLKLPRLLQACVNVISSNGWLKPALAAMELSQMATQGLWDRDSSLLQIPFFDADTVARCEAAEEEIDNVYDIMTLEDSRRDALLQLPAERMAAVARFCNGFPNVELDFEVHEADEITAGDAVNLLVQLEREGGEEDEAPPSAQVYAPLFPRPKPEGWWLVVGDAKKNTLVSIKQVTLKQKAKARLTFAAPDEPGDYCYSLYFICDSYLGCDQELEVEFSVKPAVSGSDEDESE